MLGIKKTKVKIQNSKVKMGAATQAPQRFGRTVVLQNLF